MGHLVSATLAFFTPQSGGSSNANQIDSLYKITLVIALVIFALVEAGLLYALIKFRARKGAVPAQIRGNTRLEVGWTVGAAVILLALAVVTFAKLSSIQNPSNSGPNGDKLASSNGLLYASAARKLPPDGKSLNIKVIGRQYIWQYVYPGASESDGLGAPYSYEQMVVPTNTTVTLDVVVGRRRARMVGPATRAARCRRFPATTTTPGSRPTSRASTAASARSSAVAGTRA